MKKALIFLGLILCVLCFTSCDQSSRGGLPTWMEAFLKPREDFYLILEYHKPHDLSYTEIYIELLSKDRLDSLVLNEIPFLPVYFSFDADMGYYRYVLDFELPPGTSISDYDENLDYRLIFENKEVSGTLRIPSEYYCIPLPFDHDQDYELEWTLQNNPMMQNVTFDLYINAHDYATYVRELKANQRHCTLRKTDWNHLGRLTRGNFLLEASNYRYTNGGLVWFMSAISFRENNHRTNQQDFGVERLEKLLNGEIVLPR